MSSPVAAPCQCKGVGWLRHSPVLFSLFSSLSSLLFYPISFLSKKNRRERERERERERKTCTRFPRIPTHGTDHWTVGPTIGAKSASGSLSSTKPACGEPFGQQLCLWGGSWAANLLVGSLSGSKLACREAHGQQICSWKASWGYARLC